MLRKEKMAKRRNNNPSSMWKTLTKHPEYNTWYQMIYRCYNPKCKAYKHYGGRGIRVCSRWKACFNNFLVDMGTRPKGYSIDRVDNDGNYELSNCRWATIKEQQDNSRKSSRKFTSTQIIDIRQNFNTGEATISGLVREHCVSRRTIKRIIKRETYKNIP